MTTLPFFEKLLDGEQVEWLPLGEVTKYEQPKKYLVQTKNYDESFRTPVLTAGKTFLLGFTNEVEGICQASAMPVVIFDDFTTAHKWVDFDFKVKSSAMKIIHSSDPTRFNLRFIHHWLGTVWSPAVASDHKRQWIQRYGQKRIPVPCPDNPEKSLRIQSEIVRILDTFTELTAELTTELTAEREARRKQYEYYQGMLLTSNRGKSNQTRLGDVVEMKAGKNVKAKDIGNTQDSLKPYKCYGGNGSRGFIGDFSHDGKYVLIGRQGALCGNVKRVRGKFFATEHAVVCSPSEGIDNDWLFYTLRFADLHQHKTQSAQPGLSVARLKEVMIGVPSIDYQVEVATKLDKYESLAEASEEFLPREIELRRKQYEHYRDQLFSFPPAEKVA